MNGRRHSMSVYGHDGFTVIELMIATVVFSAVLLLLTTAVINFTRSYYKGIVATNTQNVARSITDTITQTIQFNGAGYTSVPSFVSPPGSSPWYGFCFGEEAYVYQLGLQLVDGALTTPNQANQVLLKGNMAGGCGGIANAAVLKSSLASPVELLSPGMRLANLDVTPLSSGAYSLAVDVVNGDDDLLCNPAKVATSCDIGAPTMSNWSDYTTTTDQVLCKGQSGSQFCATSSLGTVVLKRIQQ